MLRPSRACAAAPHRQKLSDLSQVPIGIYVKFQSVGYFDL